MWVVVTVHTDFIRGRAVEVFGPWDRETCERERRRLLADHAYRDPHAHSGTFTAHVAPVKAEVLAP